MNKLQHLIHNEVPPLRLPMLPRREGGRCNPRVVKEEHTLNGISKRGGHILRGRDSKRAINIGGRSVGIAYVQYMTCKSWYVRCEITTVSICMWLFVACDVAYWDRNKNTESECWN